MKRILLWACLLLLSWCAYAETYVNPSMLANFFNEAKAIDKEIQETKDKLERVPVVAINRRWYYNFCKKLLLHCMVDSFDLAVATQEEYDRLVAKMPVVLEKWIDSWAKYNSCKVWWEWCDKKPISLWKTTWRTCKVDLLLRNDTKDARATYAYQISWCDTEFVKMITAENSSRDMWAKNTNANWTTDYSICQINSYYHPTITSNPRFWNDPYYVIDSCYKLYKWGTTFYWRNIRHRRASEIRFY